MKKRPALWLLAFLLPIASLGMEKTGLAQPPEPHFLAQPQPPAGQEVVWTGLVYATNEKQPAPNPKQLAGFGQKLENIFGYNQLQLLSEHREAMNDQTEHWLLPGRKFCLSVHSKNAPDRGYLLKLKLFQDKRLLVKTEAKLERQSPIFFRGPLCGKGQLIIVLLVE